MTSPFFRLKAEATWSSFFRLKAEATWFVHISRGFRLQPEERNIAPLASIFNGFG